MSFYRKTLLALFLTSSILLVLAIAGAYRAISTSTANSYKVRYQSLASTLSDTVEKLESGTEDTMRVALQSFWYYIVDHGIPSEDALRNMARKLHVSSVEIIRQDGTFIRSSKYKLSDLPNLFSFCSGYRDLFNGKSNFDRTPLMPIIVDHRVLKFALIPTKDRRYVINVGTEVGYIGELLRSAMKSDKNVESLALYTPSGIPLASFVRAGSSIVEDSGPASLKAAKVETSNMEQGAIEISTPVKSTVQTCCECVVKRLVTDANGKFNYILRTRVSVGDLNESLGRIAWTILCALAVGLLMAFFLSRIIARKLTSRIEHIGRKTREIIDLKDLTVRFNFDGTDEISKIGATFDKLLAGLESHQKDLLQAERSKAIAEIARDVAHNMRSPLVAAENVVQSLKGIPDEPRRILNQAVREIRTLTDDLKAQSNHAEGKQELQKNSVRSKNEEKPSLQHLGSIIDSEVTKKRVELKDKPNILLTLDLDLSSYPLFSVIQSADLRIALSNIINNSVEAITGSHGTIIVSCRNNNGRAKISITDNGCGISKEVIPTLGNRGVSYGKPGGSGLGLAHARGAIEAWGGVLRISSDLGRGTEVVLELPCATPPDWFVSELKIEPDEIIVILDDERSIHDLWSYRLKPGILIPKNQIFHFYSGKELENWIQESKRQQAKRKYLVDFELRADTKDGITLIDELKIAEHSILVTGLNDEDRIKARVSWLGIKMIPKSLISAVPIVIHEKSLAQSLLSVDFL